MYFCFIRTGKAHNFNKYSHGTIDTLKRAYDLKSIMHYGNSGFSKNGKPTIQGIGVNKDVALGQRSGFSQTDIFEINALYDCSGMDFLLLLDPVNQETYVLSTHIVSSIHTIIYYCQSTLLNTIKT